MGIGGFNLLFFMGMASTSAVNGSLIMATNPLVTSALAALFLGERLGRVQVMAMPVALAGVGVVVLGGGAGLHLAMGDAAMIGANLSWALYNVLARRLMPAESGVSNTAGIMSMGALVMAAGGLMVGAPVQMPSSQALGALAFMAVGGSALAYLLWNAGISRLGAARTSVFLNLVPVSTMSIAALAGHPPGATQLAGAVLGAGGGQRTFVVAEIPGGHSLGSTFSQVPSQRSWVSTRAKRPLIRSIRNTTAAGPWAGS